jgi:hypothetical protein
VLTLKRVAIAAIALWIAIELVYDVRSWQSCAPAYQQEDCDKGSENSESNCTVSKIFALGPTYRSVAAIGTSIHAYKDEINAASTLAIAVFTFVLAVVGYFQWKAIREEFISSHRPRIRVKYVRPEGKIEAGKLIMVRLVSVNYGDTAATVTQFGLATCVVDASSIPPVNPFLDRPIHRTSTRLRSGMTLDHTALEAGSVTPSELFDIYSGHKQLFFFAYVDYIDDSDPPTPRQTACCRVFRLFPDDSRTILDGAFVRPDLESEYEFED